MTFKFLKDNPQAEKEEISKTKTLNLINQQTANVCQQLFQEGISVEKPSQSGFYRQTIKETVKEKMITLRKLVFAFLW